MKLCFWSVKLLAVCQETVLCPLDLMAWMFLTGCQTNVADDRPSKLSKNSCHSFWKKDLKYPQSRSFFVYQRTPLRGEWLHTAFRCQVWNFIAMTLKLYFTLVVVVAHSLECGSLYRISFFLKFGINIVSCFLSLLWLSILSLFVSGTYSNISDDHLNNLVRQAQSGHNGIGLRLLMGYLHSQGYRVQWERVCQSLLRTDPTGVYQRWRASICRRQ